MLNQVVAGGAGSTEAVVGRAEVLLLIALRLYCCHQGYHNAEGTQSPGRKCGL